MNINKERNCYNFKDFGHIAQHYREKRNHRRIEQEKRVNYKNNRNTSNLNKKENLIFLD